MVLSHEEIRQLANLARLQVSEQELDPTGETLERILGYVSRLSSVDTTGVSDMELSHDMSVLRTDEARPTDDLDLERLQTLFPDRLGQLMRVPGVFEKPKN